MKPFQVMAVCLAVMAAVSWLQFMVEVVLHHSGTVSTREILWRGADAMFGTIVLVYFLRTFPFFTDRE